MTGLQSHLVGGVLSRGVKKLEEELEGVLEDNARKDKRIQELEQLVQSLREKKNNGGNGGGQVSKSNSQDGDAISKTDAPSGGTPLSLKCLPRDATPLKQDFSQPSPTQAKVSNGETPMSRKRSASTLKNTAPKRLRQILSKEEDPEVDDKPAGGALMQAEIKTEEEASEESDGGDTGVLTKANPFGEGEMLKDSEMGIALSADPELRVAIQHMNSDQFSGMSCRQLRTPVTLDEED